MKSCKRRKRSSRKLTRRKRGERKTNDLYELYDKQLEYE
jgi:hypothetical protein